MPASVANISREALEEANVLVCETYEDERNLPGSPITPEMVRLNLDHLVRVRTNARKIAEGEGLDTGLLELAAILHDVAKLDHRDAGSGGVDTWHHHYCGAALARKLILGRLRLGGEVADAAARMIEAHSDIPFIRRYWESVYHSNLPGPETEEEFALRDADVIDLLWVGGMSKIVHIRQAPGSAFYLEDGGDIQKAIASARRSFLESSGVISTGTGRQLAEKRVLTVEAFFDHVADVATLREFEQAYERFIAAQCRP